MARAFSISHPETSLSARRICGTLKYMKYPWIFIFFIYIYTYMDYKICFKSRGLDLIRKLTGHPPSLC